MSFYFFFILENQEEEFASYLLNTPVIHNYRLIPRVLFAILGEKMLGAVSLLDDGELAFGNPLAPLQTLGLGGLLHILNGSDFTVQHIIF